MAAARIDNNHERFFKEYGAALDNGSAALFAGAGLSRAAGYVDWKGLLRGLADELGLNLDIEQDLVSVAQYHVNASNRDRTRLNQLLIEEFTKEAVLTPAHQVLARLPLRTIWTTNYDQMIERAFANTSRQLAVRINPDQLTDAAEGDANLYKLHGDISEPDKIVLTTEDYEEHAARFPQLRAVLQAELVRKTFLFIGFSFSDPNLEYVLRRLRVSLGEHQRQHFAIFQRARRSDYASKKKFEYAANKQRLRVRDLERYAITSVLVDDYGEIPTLLEELERRYYRRSIFVSGAAADPAPFGLERLDSFCRALGQRIISEEYNLVSGFGLEVGSPVIVGAVEAIYREHAGSQDQRLKLRPFPQVAPQGMSREEFNTKYRSDLVATAGFTIFVSGNRREGKAVSNSPGVREEFDLTLRQGKYPLPIGASGWAAADLWQEVRGRFDEVFPKGTPKKAFQRLGDTNATDKEILDALFSLIRHLSPRPLAAKPAQAD
jgi:hypothetical protein